MKLYFSPGACSLAPNIVAHELGLPIELVRVKDKKTPDGVDFWQINPKGYVPALQFDDGAVLTEGPVISQYLADQKPEAKLVPPAGSMERYRLQEMLGFINSELHKTFSPLFTPGTPAETKAERLEYLRKRFRTIDQALAGKTFLFGDQFTIADAYLFTVTNWSKFVQLDLSEFTNLMAFQGRVAARPAVQAAMVAEGLIKAS
jgi:glutathione S-transferase